MSLIQIIKSYIGIVPLVLGGVVDVYSLYCMLRHYINPEFKNSPVFIVGCIGYLFSTLWGFLPLSILALLVILHVFIFMIYLMLQKKRRKASQIKNRTDSPISRKAS
jgi:uncharacterized membrane protein